MAPGILERARRVLATGFVVTALAALPAQAVAATGTFDVVSRVTVTSACTYNGTPALAFGSYDPIVANASVAATATATLSVVCPAQSPYTVTANLGRHSSSAASTCATGPCTRAMSNGALFLSYDIYTTPTYTTVWNTVNGIGGIGTGAMQAINVYGYIPPAEAAPAGSFTDTVTVTVSF